MTIAQQVIKDFETSTRTVALVTLARKAGAEEDRDGAMRFYHFPDGSVIGARGKGRYHQYWEVGRQALPRGWEGK